MDDATGLVATGREGAKNGRLVALSAVLSRVVLVG